ncbi:MAG: 5-(carboxyamino)imidazole ribonucleotide mutase [Desulfovibrio sp.]|nr:5-(carboxyamino)imidazole ribonucleotide mutase [Desulfovibrio sp.]
MSDVLVLMGSASDEAKVAPCMEVLTSMGVSFTCAITSAHRTPQRTSDLIREAEEKGCKVIICAAGMAAHLAGFVSAHTTKPVIGIPISGSSLQGMDALLSTVMMPSGFPVATVALDSAGARNAAWLACEILALTDPQIAAGIATARQRMEEGVVKASLAFEAKYQG